VSGAGDLHGLLRRAAAELERLEAVRLSRARARLRPAHVAVLGALLDTSPLTPGELCARCEAEPSTMTGLLRALEVQGLLERRRLLRDERTSAVELTPRGRAAARVAMRARAAAQGAALRPLPRGAGTKLAGLLAQFSAAARLAREEIAPVPRAAGGDAS